MKTKYGVKLFGLQLPMRKVLKYAEEVWKQHNQELWITCTVGSVHSAGSLHPYGYAVDLRSRYFTSDVKYIVAEKLRRKLGKDYQVLVRKDHIHVEYQKILDDTGF